MAADRCVAFAPGRVNLIGEHTDYNAGLSLPFAVAEGVTVTATRMEGDEMEAHALDLGEQDRFSRSRPERAGGWPAFVRGAVAELAAAGHAVPAARLEITGTLPQGAGLSSSAALEVALCLALLGLGGEQHCDRVELAQLCSRIEREWVGAQTGLLDQLASLLGRRGHALRIDFRSLEVTPVPLDLGSWTLVIAPSGETHSIAESGYNARRAECAEAARRLGLASLRDADARAVASLPSPLDMRALHVIEENARVDAMVQALGAGDVPEVGRLLDASHASLRDLYAVSTPAVERAVARLKGAGAAGARVIGGGFGGMILALLPPGAAAPPGTRAVLAGGGARIVERDARIRNWGGNHAYRAGRLHRPATLDELRRIVARAPKIHVLGTRHAFGDIADSAELVTLDGLPAGVDVNRAAGTVAVGAGATYGALATTLAGEGMALGNLPSTAQIAIGGAIATATHGSGDANGNLATAVAAIELVTSTGDLAGARRGDADFDGLVVGLGATGAVTRVTLDVEPAYEVAQQVFEGLGWDALFEHFDAVFAAGDSVSLFTRWGDTVDQVWVKRRTDGATADPARDLFGARPAASDCHPIAGMDPAVCTAQLGRPGPWWDRLPHFRMGFTPSAGAEIQSEFHLARRDALDAISALRGLAAEIRPLLYVCEIRTVAADRLWMSPNHERDSVALHFTWRRDQPAVERVLASVETALEPFAPRPHWGKLFLADAAAIGARYERVGEFTALLGRIDPRGAFRNAWLERHVG